MLMKFIDRSNYIPFLFLKDGTILTYRHGYIYFMNQGLSKSNKSVRLSGDFKYRFLSRISLLARLLRVNIRTSIEVDEECILLQVDHLIMEFNPNLKKITDGFYLGSHIRALNITKIESIRGFDDMVVFGEYLENFSKKSVSVFKRDGVDKWSAIFTFSDGMINHVHNIIPDPFNDCVWILTGDFDAAACIWMAKDNFHSVTPIFLNSQLYRSCVAFPTKDGLVYATDSPFEQNYICLLYNENGIYKTKQLCEINGSCIYGTKVTDKFIFSTAVEGDGRDASLVKLFFSKKRGTGIKDNKSHVYAGNLKTGFEDVYQVKKDILPFAFQFGTIMFPKGENCSDIIYATHVATKYDSSTRLIKL